ncbi:AraC family transcriptional regulator [Paenibacillus sp. GCM10023252]|uniref:helix-turn-helix transcriptional regulator n=1 Tax=Paenibacillus sp. GCM10023252 TaxID=3252649 RepID=UPI003611B194
MDARFESRPVYMDANEFRREAGDSWIFPLHRHESNMELLFIAEGHCAYTIEGRHYSAKAGDVILFHPNAWHEERSDPDGAFQFYYVGFHSLQFKGLPAYRVYAAAEVEAPVFALPHYYNRLTVLFRELCAEGRAGWPEPLSGTGLLLERLLLEVHRAKLHPSPPPGRPTAQGIVRQVRRTIEERYTDALTLRKLADEVYISPSYLSHLFQQQVGLAPIQYLIHQRINAAKRYLATTELSFASIAEAVGYESSTAFQTLFKREVGVTPGQYRKENRLQ